MSSERPANFHNTDITSTQEPQDLHTEKQIKILSHVKEMLLLNKRDPDSEIESRNQLLSNNSTLNSAKSAIGMKMPWWKARFFFKGKKGQHDQFNIVDQVVSNPVSFKFD
jgi:hypothetical protein